MKKFYSFITFMAALVLSAPAKADVQSATELFGTWTFTADVQCSDANYQELILSESEVTILKDESGIFDAEIDGLCGVRNSYQQATLKTQDNAKALKITNPNGGGYDAWGSLGLWMADIDGSNPFGSAGFGPLFYTINDEGTEITIPDFSFVSISNFNAEKGEIIATVTNAKLTLKERQEIEIKDLTGSYEFNVTTFHDYEIIENWPTTLKMDLTKKISDDNRFYDVTWAWEQFDTISMDGIFDGNVLNLYYSAQVIAYDTIFLAPSNDISLSGTIGFNLVGDNLSMSTGCAFVVPFYNEYSELDSLSYIFWYGGGIAKKMKEGPAFDYAGTYHAVGNVAWNLGIVENANTEGDIVIEYFDAFDAYVVTEFMGYDSPFTLNYDLMYLIPDEEDPMKATITCACLDMLGMVGEYDVKFLATRDGNLQDNPVSVKFDADGNMSIGEICYATTTWMGSENDALAVWFSSITATKDIPSPMDWNGTFKINDISYAYLSDDASFINGDSICISYEENYDAFVVMNFLGNETYFMNYGGMTITPDSDDPRKATMTYGTLDFDPDTYDEITLYAADMSRTYVNLTMEEDGTVTIGDFSVAQGPYMMTPTKLLANTSVREAQKILWNGDFKLNPITFKYIAPGASVPTCDTLSVSYYADYDCFIVMGFLGFDTYSMNYGAMVIEPDENDVMKATMSYGILDYDFMTNEETSLYSTDLSKTPVELTLEKDGTVTVGGMAIAKGPYFGTPTEILLSTDSDTGVKAFETGSDVRMFNLNGMETGRADGIVIMKMNGRTVKVLGK